MPARDKILITGSSGMLGTDLSHRLSSGYDVAGMDIADNGKAGIKEFLKCDITDAKAVEKSVGSAKPKVVVHTAAWADVDGCEGDKDKALRINSDGTKNVAKACASSGARLVYISTDFVFDGLKKEPYTETDKPAPLSVYGLSKFLGEEAVAMVMEEYFILRTSWLYGKNGKNFVDTIIASAKKSDELKVVDDQVGSPTYTRDLADAIYVLLAKTGSSGSKRDDFGIYNVSNSGSVSWYEYAKAILKITGSGCKVKPISSRELARPAKRPAMSVLDNSRFTGLTGHRMRDWSLALKEYLQKN